MASLADSVVQMQNDGGLQTLTANRNSIRKNITDTEKLLKAVPEDVQSRARVLGGPVTQAVMDRLTTAKQQPITKQLGDLSAADTNASGAINDLNSEINMRLNAMIQDRQLQAQQQQATDANALQRWIIEQNQPKPDSATSAIGGGVSKAMITGRATPARGFGSTPTTEPMTPLEQTLNQLAGSGLGVNYKNPIFYGNEGIVARQPSVVDEASSLAANLTVALKLGGIDNARRVYQEMRKINPQVADRAALSLQSQNIFL